MRFVDLCVLISIHNKCIKINCRVRNNLHKVPKKQIYKSCIIYKTCIYTEIMREEQWDSQTGRQEGMKDVTCRKI